MKKRSKRYKLIEKKKVKDKLNLQKSLDLIKEICTSKMDESIDLSIKINTKQSKGGDFNLRTVVKLPHGNGKKFKIAVLCEQEKVEEAKKIGADVAGSQELLDKMSNGELNFDKLICTPGMMSKIGKLGKILGPKGLMPNPKTGTVTPNVAKAVEDFKKGKIEIKNDKFGNLQMSIGKVSFDIDNLLQNFDEVIAEVLKSKPASSKGEFIKSVYISSTMGPSIPVDINL